MFLSRSNSNARTGSIHVQRGSCPIRILIGSQDVWFGHVHWKVRHGQNEKQVENAIVRFKPVRQASARARG